MPLPLLHDAGGVLAVAKPAGLPTQAPVGIVSVESLVRERLFGVAAGAAIAAGQRRHPGGFLGIPHRLDRAVSGVLLLATTPRAARQLARQFERRQIRKTYLALVAPAATPVPAAGTSFEWRDTIRKVPDEPRAELVAAGTSGGREALTHGHVRESGDDGTLLLELEPVTGRMHQLRVQAAARGLPVVGDLVYGGRPAGELPADDRSAAIALHAWRISFLDPTTGVETIVSCPPPPSPPWPGRPAA